jgi:hypothetical protein
MRSTPSLLRFDNRSNLSPMTPEERASRRRARARAVRRRRLVLALACGTLVAAGIAVASSRNVAAREPSQAGAAACIAQIKVARPAWLTSHRATVLVDSVLLGGVESVRSNLRGWNVDVLGRAAVMIGPLEEEIRESATRIAPLAVVGVGYNSLWERGRKNYRNWARDFDRDATALVRTLRRQGAGQIVWVTLRDARRSVIPADSRWQFDKYAWYFPYVNERLRLLDRRLPYVVLADWATVSDRRGLTYDAFHLDPDGQALMAHTIRQAFQDEAARQVAAARSAAVGACRRKAAD